MRLSNDENGSDPKNLCSLGVVDLDLSLSPDVFGLRAFDSKLPLTRMMPGSNPCELRLMLPNSTMGADGFHDMVIENLSASPTWRSSHASTADVMSLRRRWPKAIFRTMWGRAKEVERLRRFAHRRPEWEFRHNAPGFCPVCLVDIKSTLDVHMTGSHLELGQVWRCPVEWCAVWKGSVDDCLGHFNEKHGGSAFFALKNISQFFPPWTVTRDVWQAALHPDVSGIAVDARLFHEAGCRLVQVPGVEGPSSSSGAPGGVIPRLLSFVAQAMAIAQLTQLHISVPASGVPPGQVPAECFPGGASVREPSPRRVTFASDVTVLGGAPSPMHSPDIIIHEPSCPEVIEEDLMVTEDVATNASAPIVPPPPGFCQFSCPREDWQVGGDSSLFMVDEELPGWSP